MKNQEYSLGNHGLSSLNTKIDPTPTGRQTPPRVRLTDTIKPDDDCYELKTIDYQTMLKNGNTLSSALRNTINEDELENFLNSSTKISFEVKNPWSKLDKMQKLYCLQNYADRYCRENSLLQEKDSLQTFLRQSLNRKRLQRTKDVEFDKDTQTIAKIHGLEYYPQIKKFTIRNVDKKNSTLKNLGKGSTGSLRRVRKKKASTISDISGGNTDPNYSTKTSKKTSTKTSTKTKQHTDAISDTKVN